MTDSIISKIKSEMAEQGLSGTDLSQKSGVSMQYLYRILRGEHVPTLTVLLKILSALDLKLEVVRAKQKAKVG